jgi:hypothetical protein
MHIGLWQCQCSCLRKLHNDQAYRPNKSSVVVANVLFLLVFVVPRRVSTRCGCGCGCGCGYAWLTCNSATKITAGHGESGKGFFSKLVSTVDSVFETRQMKPFRILLQVGADPPLVSFDFSLSWPLVAWLAAG